MEDEDLEEYPFSFVNTPSSLKQLAATEVALTLWRYKYYSNSSNLTTQPQDFVQQKFNCEKMLVVPIPSRTRAQIDGKIASIGEELAEWINFHFKEHLFDGNFEGAFSKCFEHFVLNAFCSIDFTASAINILNSGGFGNMENYKIACAFCLEDQVRRFRPLVVHDARVDRTDDDSLMFYWNCRMKSKADSIDNTVSIEERIDTIFRYSPSSISSWAPFEYFLNTWSDHDRESQTVLFLKRGGHLAMKRLLPTLNRFHAEKVFEEMAAEILHFLIKNDEYFQHVHQLWAVLGYTLLKDESSFFRVLQELWKLIFNLLYGEAYPTGYLVGERVNDFLLHTWSNAPDELKVAVSNNHINEFFKMIPQISGPSCAQDMTFLLELLTKSSNTNNEELLKAHWRELFFIAKPLFLEKLARSCLPDDEAVKLFKEHIFSRKYSGYIFRDFVEKGLYSALKNYLNFCSSNAEIFQQLSMKVLESNIDYILRHSDDQFAEFDWFVNEVFLGVKTNIEEFKARMISSPYGLHCLLKTYHIYSNDLSTISNRFVTSEEKLLVMKRKLLEHCCTIYPIRDRESFPVSELEWQKLLEWCTPITDDAEEILAFKRSFNIDEIYLSRVMCYLDKSSCPSPEVRQSALWFIDRFSKWYFTNAKVEKKFKLGKVKYYCKHVELFRNKLKSNVTEDRRAMGTLLNWFFDNDSEKVREFRETWARLLRL